MKSAGGGAGDSIRALRVEVARVSRMWGDDNINKPMQCLQSCCFVFVQYLARWCPLTFYDIENLGIFKNLITSINVASRLALLRSSVSYYAIRKTWKLLAYLLAYGTCMVRLSMYCTEILVLIWISSSRESWGIPMGGNRFLSLVS